MLGWIYTLLDPFRTAVPFGGQITWILTGLSPKRDCSSRRVKQCKKSCSTSHDGMLGSTAVDHQYMDRGLFQVWCDIASRGWRPVLPALPRFGVLHARRPRRPAYGLASHSILQPYYLLYLSTAVPFWGQTTIKNCIVCPQKKTAVLKGLK